MAKEADRSEKRKTKFLIIGTGFAGIAAAVRLKQHGERDFLMLERANDIGGVWRDNRYPGSACDVESHLYSLSFAPNPNWNRMFSSQPDIHAYLQKCVEKYGLASHILFQHNVLSMEWDESNREWEVHTSKNAFRASLVIGAFGALSNPSIPHIKGLELFDGEAFHSARWPLNFNPEGKRIAVIGTGASAIQFIPHLQREAGSLHVFQRTPAWVIPRQDKTISRQKQKAFRRFPLLQRIARMKIYLKREALVIGFRNPKLLGIVEKIAKSHMQKAIQDPVLLEKLTPSYKIGCKRILLSNTYYPALSQPNVEVNVNGISEVTRESVVDSQGKKVPVDAIIFGTGFQVTELPLAKHITGRERRTLHESWNGSPKAYMGTTIAGFPNLFLLQGPNTGLGHSSVILMIEAQVNHITKVLRHMERNKLATIEPKAASQLHFLTETDKKMKGTVWTSGGCKSWYIDETGRNSTLWPSFTFSFIKKAVWWKRQDYSGR